MTSQPRSSALPPRRRARLMATVGSLLCLGLAAFSHASGASLRTPALGTVIDNPKLQKLGGGQEALLGAEKAQVLVFFRPAQDQSLQVLGDLEKVRNALTSKPVRWVALASSRHPRGEIEAILRDSGATLPVLVDKNDGVRAALAVVLDPAVVLVDGKRRLVALVPFQRINFAAGIEARVRHLLGEIDDAALATALNPPESQPSEAGAVDRYLGLARMLRKAGKRDKALEAVQKGIALDAKRAAAHALHGLLLSDGEDCKGAVKAFETALALEPANDEARAGLEACRKREESKP